MAFAAVSCLIETLEDLLRFTFLALKIKKLQIKILVMQPTNNLIRDSLRNFLMHWHLMTPKYITFIAIPPNEEDSSSSEFDEYISSLKTCLYLLQRRAKDILDLWLVLSVLLTFLRDSETICHDLEKMQYLERSLIDLAYRIEDTVEETVIDHSIIPEAFSFINVVVNEDPMFIMRELSFMSQILDRFNERRGLPINLQRASEENQVFDANDGFMSIFERVMNGSSPLELVAIVGMGGIGKTTLARRIFKCPLTDHFYIRAWVVVSQVHRVRDILTGILSSISQVTDEICEKGNGELAEMLWRSLKGKRFLIVLDNIWSTKAWDDVKRCFPDDKNGSRIILTTRQMKVADYVNPRQPPHFVNLLDIEQSWKLLQRKVFGEEPCPRELEYVGRKIARKCQGLPLVIVVIGGILRQMKRTCEFGQDIPESLKSVVSSDPEQCLEILRPMKRTCDFWQDIAESVKSVVSSDPEQCLEILALSYNHLPYHLKACFLDMGIFPEDCEIEVPELIEMWIAKGFVDKSSSSEESWESESDQDRSDSSLETKAETYLKDLIDRNLVLVGKGTFGGEIRTCRLHEVIRDLCIREAQKKNFMHIMRMDCEAHSASMINPRCLSHDHEKMQYLERSLIDLAYRIED